jgi:DNA repair ATPase RecN
MLIKPTEEALNIYAPLYKECIEINKQLQIKIAQHQFDEANALREKLESIAQQVNESKNELQEAFRKYPPLAEKLESERKDLFQKMRAELEK